jgi:hypothetical protein
MKLNKEKYETNEHAFHGLFSYSITTLSNISLAITVITVYTIIFCIIIFNETYLVSVCKKFSLYCRKPISTTQIWYRRRVDIWKI